MVSDETFRCSFDVQILGDLKRDLGKAESARNSSSLPIELGEEQPPLVSLGEVVMDLEGKGALAGTHCSKRKSEHSHARSLSVRGWRECLDDLATTPRSPLLVMTKRRLLAKSVRILAIFTGHAFCRTFCSTTSRVADTMNSTVSVPTEPVNLDQVTVLTNITRFEGGTT